MKPAVEKENIYNLANLISLYRLLVTPLIVYYALVENEPLFVIFISISMVSDVLDGFIARTFNMQTRFGASLDNLADFGMMVVALLGIVTFKMEEMRPHFWAVYIFFGLLALTMVISLIKFRKMPGLHLYGGVTTGYLQGFFLFVLFIWGFYEWLFYLAMGVGIIAYIEKTIILFYIDEIRTGIKGMYWLLRADSGEEKEL